MSLNLDLLTNDVTIGEMVDIINKNFNAIVEFGGGPQGPVNNKSLPGLPGLTGKSGLTGLPGDDGSTITMYDEDPNWGIVYGIGSPTYPSALSAISEGYKVNDKWVDNLNGIYYSIHGTPGNEIFEAYEFSYASSSEFWIGNPNGADRSVGTRYSGHAGVITVTTLVESGADSAPSSDPLFNTWFLINGDNYGNVRNDFKFSVDGVKNPSNISTAATIFNIPQNEYAPAFYLGDNNTNNTGNALHFGFLTYTDASGNDNQVLAINNPKGVVYGDVLSFGTKNDFFTVSSSNNDVNRVTMVDSDGATDYTDSEFWFSISRYTNLIPDGDVTSFDDMGGMRLLNPWNAGSPTLEIEFYTNSDTTDNTPGAWDKVMAINSTKTVSINSFSRAQGTLTVQNINNIASPTADEKADIASTLVLQSPNYGEAGQGGTSLHMGYGSAEGVYSPDWEGPSYIYSEYRSDTLTPGPIGKSDLILQPNEFAPDGGVMIGYPEAAANRFAVDGSVAIGTDLQAPDGGLLMGGDTRLGTGSEDSLNAISKLRVENNIVLGKPSNNDPDIVGVTLGLNSYVNASGDFIINLDGSSEQYGGAISVGNSDAGTPVIPVGITLTTINSNNGAATTEGFVVVSGKKETMGYLGVNQTVPAYAVDIATSTSELQGLRIDNNDSTGNGVAILKTPSTFTAGVGNGTDGPHLLIKNLEIQDIGFVQGGGPNDFYKGQKNIILETTYSSYDEGGPTITDLAGSVIVKTEPDNSLVIDSDFDKNTMMQILHSAAYHRHGLLIQGNDGNHLHLRGGQTNDTFFTSGGIGLNDETFKIKGSGEVISEDNITALGEMYSAAFNVTSDARLKENIKSLDPIRSLEKINELNPVSFTYIDDDNNETQLGLIAQDVEEVIPEIVNNNNPDKLYLNYTALIPVLIGAIKELNAEIEILKNNK